MKCKEKQVKKRGEERRKNNAVEVNIVEIPYKLTDILYNSLEKHIGYECRRHWHPLSLSIPKKKQKLQKRTQKLI